MLHISAQTVISPTTPPDSQHACRGGGLFSKGQGNKRTPAPSSGRPQLGPEGLQITFLNFSFSLDLILDLQLGMSHNNELPSLAYLRSQFGFGLSQGSWAAAMTANSLRLTAVADALKENRATSFVFPDQLTQSVSKDTKLSYTTRQWGKQVLLPLVPLASPMCHLPPAGVEETMNLK